MAQRDIAAYLRATTEMAYNNLVNDLSAMDADKAVGSPHDALRPAIKLVAECGSVNMMLAVLVTTGQLILPTPEDRAAFYGAVTTPEAALAVLKQGTEHLYAAIDGTAPETWGDTVPGRFRPWARADAAGYAALHMMYHDGQLNSLQQMHGDTEMHWK